ncbi:MAG: exosome complex RNA-binding protein Rrp4 [Candidatus Heimdallarchaeota archaeon]|nr:exosome complex RNA-binding protein Rrp4 [Candidatus Heimdallarchaeota archaeon]MDH5647350.1 exosome complex RNA-binding protein Rrp4 [Candidatus Heimdallarchaeota archaeon]
MTIIVEDSEIVVPGDLLADGNYKFGEGIVKRGNNFYSSLVGVFIIRNEFLQVRPLKGRYFPNVGDTVIGFIEDTNLTSWIVNIRGPYSGILLASNASRRRFDPIRHDARKIFDVGDVIKAEIISFDRTRDPQLATKYPRLGKLEGGRILETNPHHIPRIIGKQGSMISMIKQLTNSNIMVAKNGRIWIKANNIHDEERVVEAINQISREAHVSGLTDRISELLNTNKN